MSTLPKSYPLDWPGDWKRTPAAERVRSPYKVSFSTACAEVEDELRRMAGRGAFAITSNVPLGSKGRASADYSEPKDPGVAVYWLVHSSIRVLPVDAWATVRENMRAVGLALEALRQLERTKSGQVMHRAMQGFNALPPPRPSWFAELGLEKWPPTAFDIRQAFNRRLLDVHPDRGGSRDAFDKLQQARDLALGFAQLEQGATP